MRLLHAADLHLDTAFVARSDDVRRRLRDASRDALRALVDLALEERVDAVVLAGDLFDGRRISFQTERLLLTEFGRLSDAGIPIVYATGNHDPGSGASRVAALRWPEHAHVARGPEPVRVEITDDRGAVLGAITAVGHARSDVDTTLVPHFPPPMGEGAQVAVLHATVTGSASAARHARYAPTDVDALVAAGYHYWALGHIHVREALHASPGIHYPGNTQGRTQRERGPKGCLLVDLSEPGAPAVEFRRLGPIQWEDLVLDGLDDVSTLDGLVRIARAEWRDRAAESEDPPEDWIVRVRLAGPSPLWRELEDEEGLEPLAEELRYALEVLEVRVDANAVHAPVDPDEHRSRKDVLGEALRLTADVRSGGTALAGLGPDQLLGLEDPAAADVYVRELLGGAEEELLARMLKAGPGDR